MFTLSLLQKIQYICEADIWYLSMLEQIYNIFGGIK